MSNPSMNKVILVGRVEAQPEIRPIGEGREKMGFRLRTERSWSDKIFSTLHRVVVWGKQIDNLRNLREGDCVSIDGRIDNRKYEANGETKWITEVVANDVQIFSSAPAPSGGGGLDDVIPF
tara:strand:- start:1354 stop:1716 length:363 start_codon:yes stop_codon:yes gene_type:complete